MLHDRREELKRQHLGNLVWYVASYLHPDAGIEPFSDYCGRLDKDPHGRGASSNEAAVAAVENMILTFLPKRGDSNGDEVV